MDNRGRGGISIIDFYLFLLFFKFQIAFFSVSFSAFLAFFSNKERKESTTSLPWRWPVCWLGSSRASIATHKFTYLQFIHSSIGRPFIVCYPIFARITLSLHRVFSSFLPSVFASSLFWLFQLLILLILILTRR